MYNTTEDENHYLACDAEDRRECSLVIFPPETLSPDVIYVS